MSEKTSDLSEVEEARYRQKLELIDYYPYTIKKEMWSDNSGIYLTSVTYPDIVNHLLFTPSISHHFFAWTGYERTKYWKQNNSSRFGELIMNRSIHHHVQLITLLLYIYNSDEAGTESSSLINLYFD